MREATALSRLLETENLGLAMLPPSSATTCRSLSPEMTQKTSPQRRRRKQAQTDLVEQGIQQKPDRDEQRPSQHAATKRHIEQHEQGKNHQVMQVHQRREPERGSGYYSRGPLPRRTRRVQGLDDGLDQLEEGKHRGKV